MEKTVIYGFEFDLETAHGCTEAQTLVSNRIAELEKKKQDLEQKLESCFSDFGQSQKDYAAKQDAENEIVHCERLLKSLAEQHQVVLGRDNILFWETELQRIEKQSAALAKLCLKEIPTLCRKLAIIAAVLEKNRDENHNAYNQAKKAGVRVSNIKSPLTRIIGDGVHGDNWYKYLRLPLLDESMEYYSYWPLPRNDSVMNENPEIHRLVETLLKSEDIEKELSTLLRQVEKREVVLRQPKPKPEPYIEPYKPMWFELPLGSPERAEILKTRIAGTAKRDLGDIVKFWLGLEERRRLNSFIHLLNDNERDSVLARLPEPERQKYWDYMEDYENSDELTA